MDWRAPRGLPRPSGAVMWVLAAPEAPPLSKLRLNSATRPIDHEVYVKVLDILCLVCGGLRVVLRWWL